MKKVLIITYYWPPAGGPGVQRVLKFAKYLPQFGWQPVILTVRNGQYASIDKSLSNEISPNVKVYKTRLLTPENLYKKFLGMSMEERIPTAVMAEKTGNWKKHFSNFIRLNLFIPDAKVGWIPFAKVKGRDIIKNEKPDLIFSSSPPPTVHLIAKSLAKKSGLKWVADFRDPWTDIHYYENQPRLKLTKIIDQHMERSILKSVDKLICISRLDIEQDFGKKTSLEKCLNIANGYDEQDFNFPVQKQTLNNKFTLMHLGAIGSERNPTALFSALKRLKKENMISQDNFQLVLVGKVENETRKSIQEAGLGLLTDFQSYLPHKDALQKSAEATMLLLLVTQSKKNMRILPGKTFEYLRMGKPVLMLGPKNGETARIINDCKAGVVLDYNEEMKIYNTITEYFTRWKEHKKLKIATQEMIQHYSRENITRRLAEVFNNLVKKSA